MRKYVVFIVVILTVLAQEASAQKYPERSQVRKGNRAYEREDFGRSIERYTRAAELASESFEAQYNLANALFRTQAYDKAAEIFGALAADSLRTLQDRADAFYGLGDAQLAQQQLKEALESFKNALRINPDDEEARFNYAYTKKLLKDQQNQQNQQNQQDQQNQDQNKDQNQDQNQNGQGQQNPQDQNGKDKQDPQNQDGQDQQNPDDPSDKNPEGDGGQQPRPSKISPEEQQRMLDAIQAQEDRTQEKLKEKVPVRVRGNKSW